MNYRQVNNDIGKEARIFVPDGMPPLSVDFAPSSDGVGYSADGWHCKCYDRGDIALGPRWEYHKSPKQRRGHPIK
jgi:hypothetical protein